MVDLRMLHPGPLPTVHEGSRDPRVRLRVATDADTPRLSRLLSETFTPDLWDVTRVRTELICASDVPRVWVALRDEELVGTASERIVVEPTSEYGYLHWVATSPSARGLGIGAAVTSAVLAGFAEGGLERAVLDTDDGRHPAINMYLRLGFIPQPRSACEESAWSRILSCLASNTWRR